MNLYDRQTRRDSFSGVGMGAHEWLKHCEQQGVIENYQAFGETRATYREAGRAAVRLSEMSFFMNSTESIPNAQPI